MLSRRTLIAAATILMLPIGNVAAEAPAEQVQGAAQFIASLGDSAIHTLGDGSLDLAEREVAIRALLDESFDIAFIGRFVLGRHWRRASAEQRGAYNRLFREFLLTTYSRRLGGAGGRAFAITGARPAGRRDIVVQTRIERAGGTPIVADWRVRVIDQRYKVIDAVVEGVSMAVTQRTEFTTVIRNHGMDGLLRTLRTRTRIQTAKAS